MISKGGRFWLYISSLTVCVGSFLTAVAQTDVKVRTLGKDESLSRSGQILVRSTDARARAVMASYADTVSVELGNILGDSNAEWEYPIEIETKGSLSDVGVSGRTLATRIDLIEGGRFVLRLFVKLSDEFSREPFTREVLRLLILERMLRDHDKVEALDGRRLEVPDWILSGVNGLMEYRRLGRPSDLYAGIVRSRQLLSVDEILKTNPDKLDSLSRATYEASAAALLEALFDQPNGAKNFSTLLSHLILFDGDTQLLLKQEFPGLRGEEKSVDKWWALQVATMGELQAMEYMDVEQTEAMLDEALQVNFQSEEADKASSGKKKNFLQRLNLFRKKDSQAFTTGRIHDFEQFYRHKDCDKVLENSQLKLRTLQYRCFPLYTSVISGYEEIVTRLLKGKHRNVAEDLTALDDARARIGATVERVSDYLNYYEATQLAEPGVDFEKYHKVREKLRREKAPVRSDRISKYLDEIEREFSDRLTP